MFVTAVCLFVLFYFYSYIKISAENERTVTKSLSPLGGGGGEIGGFQLSRYYLRVGLVWLAN